MLAHVRSTSRPGLSLGQLEVDLNKIKMLIADLNGKVSVIPLVWFSFTFGSSLSDFVEYQNNQALQDPWLRLYKIYRFSVGLVGVLTVGMLVDCINHNLETEYQRQYEKILVSEYLSERRHYVKARKHRYRLKLKACGMFYLDKKSILSYISALVTFTILFMQLNKVL
ncbi:hypothetical protein HDE_06719 [Halotydeus destructor]|nr:hypothetical protein HDE_06719 [Halotydeus destructor]